MKAPFLLLALGLILLSPAVARAETCLATECHAEFDDFPEPHQPVAAGECLACHRQTATAHPLKGGKSFDLVQQGAALCEQCHDKLGKKRVVHAPVKSGDCLDCHQPHGAANRFLLAVGEDQSALCFICHDDSRFKQKSMHGPAAAGACTSCHSPHESTQKFLLAAPVRELCLQCHQDFARQMKTAPVVHAPVKDAPCTNCHDAHASGATFMLKTKMPDLCFSCHADVGKRVTAAKVQHRPVAEAGSCGSCHSTHFSQAKGLLPTDEKSLCLGCHGVDNLGKPALKNIRKELLEKPAPQRARAKKDDSGPKEKKYLHGPLREGRCADCHDPHGSDFTRILTGPYPADIYAPYKVGVYDFCLQCHDKNLLRFEETTIYTRFRNGKQNLHYLHVADGRKGRTCKVCHEPHASDGAKLISEQGMPFGDWKIPIRFQATETGGSCAPGCHRPLQYDREKPAQY